MGTCTFQFWVDRIESFYCKLDKCSWQLGSTASEWNSTLSSEPGAQAEYQLPTRLATTARSSNAHACPGDSSAARTGASVSDHDEVLWSSLIEP